MQSYYRTTIDEAKIKKSFTESHNYYIDQLIEKSGGNFSDAQIEEIEALKF